MTKDIKMPQLSEDAESGTIVEILVKEGDEIEEEQSIVAIESDKASVEVPSPEAGTVKKISVSEGDDISVGDVILTLEVGENGEADEDEEEPEEEPKEKDSKEDESEESETQEEDSDEDESDSDEEDEVKEKPRAEKEKQKEGEDKEDNTESGKEEKEEQDSEKKSDKAEKKDSSETKGEKSTEEVPAAPSVRRLSRELEVDIYQVEGSGPGGRITSEDVKAHAEQGTGGKQKQKKKTSSAELPDFSQWGATQREKLSSIRRITAESMSNAWQTVPHVTQFDQADVSELEQRQAYYEKQAEKSGGKLTLTASLLKVTAAALRAFPKFNASIDLDNEEVILKQYYHVGVAVDTEQGLLVPVIRDVDKKSVVELSVELPEIAQKARDGKLSSDEMQGGTFTVSNLGGIGGTNFTPIVYHPQVAILGVSRTQIQPVNRNDTFEPRSILPLSLSYDHRLIDGAEAARFLRWICRALEDPMVALMEG